MSRLIRLILFAIVGLLFFIYLYYGEYDLLPGVGEEINLYIFTLVSSVTIGFGITAINKRLNEKLPWRKNILARFVAGLSLDVIWLAGLLILFTWLANLTGIIDYEMFRQSIAEGQIEIKVVVLSVLLLFVTTLIEFNTYSYTEYSVGQIRRLRAERKQLELQFEALKSQLSPHYLFNSMNTISSLVYKDANLAETFIRNLADTFNYVLHTRDVKLVSLKEELEALKDFRYLLRIRYAAAVDVNIDIRKEEMNAPIPPLTLQLLVENAVKHNIISDDEPLKIHIRNEADEIVVLNNKTGTPSKTSSHKVGIDNIRKRYAFFTPREVKVLNENYFEVRLPILSNA